MFVDQALFFSLSRYNSILERWREKTDEFFCPARNLEPRERSSTPPTNAPRPSTTQNIYMSLLFPLNTTLGLRPIAIPAMNQQGALHIPRPVLTVVQVRQEDSPPPPSELTVSVAGNYVYELSARCDTPTRFTLLGQSGVIVRTTRSTPTTCQLSMTFCTLALLALVGMIVYMEG